MISGALTDASESEARRRVITPLIIIGAGVWAVGSLLVGLVGGRWLRLTADRDTAHQRAMDAWEAQEKCRVWQHATGSFRSDPRLGCAIGGG